MIDAKLINYIYKGLRADYNALYKRIEEDTIFTKKEFKKRFDELQEGLSAYRSLISEIEYEHPSIFREIMFRHSVVRYLQNEISSLEERGERRFDGGIDML
ncbi:hypothetical protein [Ectobacillus funiculus]|uniref:hypothetical protein n=1 Tax=Ectobacillus funiculus TaxID=137993 RepID=UPI00101DCDCE|nr:hypothetical protein [Ectobacillus funiculus]